MKKRASLEGIYQNPRNIHFQELVDLAEAIGFQFIRQKGSHKIFKHPKVNELLNLQDFRGKAKPYQVRQFLKLVEKYKLDSENNS